MTGTDTGDLAALSGLEKVAAQLERWIDVQRSAKGRVMMLFHKRGRAEAGKSGGYTAHYNGQRPQRAGQYALLGLPRALWPRLPISRRRRHVVQDPRRADQWAGRVKIPDDPGNCIRKSGTQLLAPTGR